MGPGEVDCAAPQVSLGLPPLICTMHTDARERRLRKSGVHATQMCWSYCRILQEYSTAVPVQAICTSAHVLLRTGVQSL